MSVIISYKKRHVSKYRTCRFYSEIFPSYSTKKCMTYGFETSSICLHIGTVFCLKIITDNLIHFSYNLDNFLMQCFFFINNNYDPTVKILQ